MINTKLLHMFKLEREMTRYLHAIWDNLQQGHVLFSMYSQFEYLCVRDELQELYLELDNRNVSATIECDLSMVPSILRK